MGLSKVYLILYNSLQCLGWACLFVKLAPFLNLQAHSTKGLLIAKNPESLYQELGYAIRVLLTAALLEIVHAAAGLVRSNPWVTAQQVFGYFSVKLRDCFIFNSILTR